MLSALLHLLCVSGASPTCSIVGYDTTSEHALEKLRSWRNRNDLYDEAFLFVDGHRNPSILSELAGFTLTQNVLQDVAAVIRIPDTPAELGGAWRITEYLGSGSTGAVYRAIADSGHEVAVKVTTRRGRSAKELAVEALMLTHLEPLPFVPSLHFHGHMSQWSIAVMDFAGHRLQSNSQMRVDRRMSQAADLFSLLRNLHDSHVIHGDVKPQNVMTGGKELSLIDFGYAAIFRDPDTLRIRDQEKGSKLPTEGLGTRYYASVRAVEGEVKSQRDDAISAFFTILDVEGKYNTEAMVSRLADPRAFDANMYEWLKMPDPSPADEIHAAVWQVLTSLRYGQDIPGEIPRLYRTLARDLQQPYTDGELQVATGSGDAMEGGVMPHHVVRPYTVRYNFQKWTVSMDLAVAKNVYKAYQGHSSLLSTLTMKFGERHPIKRRESVNEANILYALQDGLDDADTMIPELVHFGSLVDEGFPDELSVLVMRPQVEFPVARSTVAETCVLGLDILNTLEYMHQRDIIYNAAISPQKVFRNRDDKFYIVDFTQARYYTEIASDGVLTHISDEDADSNFRHHYREFSSENAINGKTLSRRDDVESLLYALVYWSGTDVGKLRRDGRLGSVLASNQEMKPLNDIYKHVRSLAFTAEPDYRLLRGYLADGIKQDDHLAGLLALSGDIGLEGRV